jgi:hypothetical protein
MSGFGNVFPVLGGCPRSGTTLLRLMLDAHPLLAIPPETAWLISGNLQELFSAKDFVTWITKTHQEGYQWTDMHLGIESLQNVMDCGTGTKRFADWLPMVYGAYAARFNKSMSGDKTPGNLLHMEEIQKAIPAARFIHIIRDGRGVADSWRKQWFASSGGYEGCLLEWKSFLTKVRHDSGKCRYYHEVRYEDLILHTEDELKKICHFLDLPWAPEMLDYHLSASRRIEEHEGRPNIGLSKPQRIQQQASSIRPPISGKITSWKDALSYAEQELAAQLIGDELKGYNY